MHISLYVSNLAKTINFYNKFFGQEPDKIEKGYTKYILNEPSLIISFIENEDRVVSNFGHLGFQVETQEEMYSKLKWARSLEMVSKEEIGTACCYAVQDKFWVNDPDGVQWEIYYFHEDVKFNDPQYELNEADTCCLPLEKESVNLVDLNQKQEASCEPGNGCC